MGAGAAASVGNVLTIRKVKFVQALFLQLKVNKGSCGPAEPLEGQ